MTLIMSGHSKWAQIKRQKGAADQKRGALFSKLAQAITAAAKTGGPNSETNFKLRLAINQAKTANMPKDNIKRAIESGVLNSESTQLDEIIYEAFGPNGSAIIINCATNNRNRLIGEIKSVLNKHNGKLAQTGDATRYFLAMSRVVIDTKKITPQKKESLTLQLMDYGAEDLIESENKITVDFLPKNLPLAIKKLEADNTDFSVDTTLKPINKVSLAESSKTQFKQLLAKLNEIDDIKLLYTNAE